MQDLVLSLRRRGTSTLIVHHSGKGGQQRGTSRREDVLNTVISLHRPEDYEPTQGARFEVHFEKTRGFAGADASPFEAAVGIDRDGAISWQATELKQETRAAAFEMFDTGQKASDVARELGVDRSTAFRWQAKWRGRDA